jgi:hypothetical protein
VTRRRPPRPAAPPADRRPRRTLVAPGASPEEAAAIVAALEQFLRDTALPAPAAARPTPSGWLRAALLEGIGAGERRRGGWGDPHP